METVIDQIGEAIVATGKIVDGVEDSQWSCSTPCEDWDARALTNHFVGGLRMFAAAITGTEAAGDFSTDWLGADPKAAYYAAAREATAAWHSPGALDKTIELSFGPVPGQLAAVIHLTEIFVHGLDLAVATGQESRVDQEMSQRLLAMMKQAGTIDTFRVPEIFEPEVVPADDAPAHRKLLSFLGRKGVPPSSRSTATSVSFPPRGKRRGNLRPCRPGRVGFQARNAPVHEADDERADQRGHRLGGRTRDIGASGAKVLWGRGPGPGSGRVRCRAPRRSRLDQLCQW